MGLAHSPRIVTSNLALSIDFGNTKSYSGSGTTVNDLVGSNNFTLQNSSYYTYDGSSMSLDIDRTNSPTAEAGGYLEKTGLTGDLTALNYLANDHTTEVWFKADDRDPYDPSNSAPNYEGNSSLVMYPGYHSLWYFDSGAYAYSLWGFSGATAVNQVVNFSDSTEGVWTNLSAVKSGTNLKLYKNGVLKTESTITIGFVDSSGTPSSNNLRIGSANVPASGAFTWFGDITFSNLKMYKKALTAAEVQQNFNALRGRFSI